MPKKPRHQKIDIQLTNQIIPLYAGEKIRQAIEEVGLDMSIYRAVRLGQVLEAVYNQGRKDGARAAIEDLDSRIVDLKKLIPHRNPGAPKKPKKQANRKK